MDEKWHGRLAAEQVEGFVGRTGSCGWTTRWCLGCSDRGGRVGSSPKSFLDGEAQKATISGGVACGAQFTKNMICGGGREVREGWGFRVPWYLSSLSILYIELTLSSGSPD